MNRVIINTDNLTSGSKLHKEYGAILYIKNLFLSHTT
jgi:hypothetical protein